jgi:hypothetical protein
MAQPGSPASLMPPGEDWLVRRVQDLERTVAELVAHDVLRAAGVETAPDLMRIIGSLEVTGDLAVPNGSITNDALANQVTGDTGTAFASGLSLNSAAQDCAAVSVTVPAGFTEARVMAVSALAAGSGIAVNCRTRIGGSDGGMLTGVNGVASSAHSVGLTGLVGGGTITAVTRAASIPNTASGMANTTIFAMFFR